VEELLTPPFHDAYPHPSNTIPARAEGYTHTAEVRALLIVPRPTAILCRARVFSLASTRGAAVVRVLRVLVSPWC
jgi:hypothetical protein